MTKNCIECGESKELSDYYTHPKMADGHLGVCKVCHKARMKHRRMTNPAVQAYDRLRYQVPERKAFGAFNSRRWRANNPEAYKAHNAVASAKRSGKLSESPCVVCGSTKTLHAHHTDYSKPLEVTWYCALHHHRHHHD